MTSPDITPYQPLVVFDTGPRELVDRALLDAQTKAPDWDPRPGNTELVLLEAQALQVAELIYAINRVPQAVTDDVLQVLDLERSQGTAPTATLRFAISAPAQYDLPSGVQARLLLPDGDSLIFTTTEAVAVSAGGTQALAQAVADLPTAAANGLPAGTALELLSPVLYVEAVALHTAVSAGADPEDETAYRNRGAQRLSRLTSTLVRPEHFEAYALEQTGVFRALALDNYDGAATNPGHVTIAVLGSGGATLSAADRELIRLGADEQAQANLAVHIVNPTITAVAVTVTVVARDGYTAAEVLADVTATLDGYLSPDTWPWAATVYRNELISVIDSSPSVSRIVTLTAPAGDVTLAGVAPLADLGAVSVTVQAGP